jgi:ubiquinone/menaquinone biosynthesis C-methylase UbiE
MKHSGQDDSGLKRLLTNPRFYELFQKFLGGDNAKKWLVKNVWAPRSGDVIVDIGCGSGNILEYLPPDIQYLGIDTSEEYIRSARRRFAAGGTFFLGTAQDFVNQNNSYFGSADLVLCNGLLHHLSDCEALEVLELSKRIMKSDGRLVCLEATFLARQTRLSKWILNRDRGKHIRSEQEWKNLIGQAFESYSTHILTGLIRIPYTHIVIECLNARSSEKNGNP